MGRRRRRRRPARNRAQRPSSLPSRRLPQAQRILPSRTHWNSTSTGSIYPTLLPPPLLLLCFPRLSIPLRHQPPQLPASLRKPSPSTIPATLLSSAPPPPPPDTPSSRPTLSSSHAASPIEQSSLTTFDRPSLTSSIAPDRILPTTRALLDVQDRLRTEQGDQDRTRPRLEEEEATTRRRSGLLPTSESGRLPLETRPSSPSETTLSREVLAGSSSLEESPSGSSSRKVSRKREEERMSSMRRRTPRHLVRVESRTTRELFLHLPRLLPYDTPSNRTPRLPPLPTHPAEPELPPLSSSPQQTQSTWVPPSTTASPPLPHRPTPSPPSSLEPSSGLTRPSRTTNERNGTTLLLPLPPHSSLPPSQRHPSPPDSDTPERRQERSRSLLSHSLLPRARTSSLKRPEVLTAPSLGIEEVLSRPTRVWVGFGGEERQIRLLREVELGVRRRRKRRKAKRTLAEDTWEKGRFRSRSRTRVSTLWLLLQRGSRLSTGSTRLLLSLLPIKEGHRRRRSRLTQVPRIRRRMGVRSLDLPRDEPSYVHPELPPPLPSREIGSLPPPSLFLPLLTPPPASSSNPTPSGQLPLPPRPPHPPPPSALDPSLDLFLLSLNLDLNSNPLPSPRLLESDPEEELDLAPCTSKSIVLSPPLPSLLPPRDSSSLIPSHQSKDRPPRSTSKERLLLPAPKPLPSSPGVLSLENDATFPLPSSESGRGRVGET